ncbi:MAG: hypothetical protein N2689_03900 [Verrucomicrobiae bacterium]|nr:hypothetical protein [Verrucomicrobiae bacterium]
MEIMQVVRGALALLALGLAGCATVVVDRLPDGVDRGYVEFRPGGDEVGRVLVEDLTHGIRQRIRPTALFGLPDYDLRVAATPGWHIYNVSVVPKHGAPVGPSKAVTVPVLKGHLTPVSVRRTIVGRDFSDAGTHIQFTISVEVGRPVPLK